MRVLVRGSNLVAWQAACAAFGVPAQANRSMTVWFNPDDQDTLNEYIVPDSGPLITWVTLSHPDWLQEIWRQGPGWMVDSVAT